MCLCRSKDSDEAIESRLIELEELVKTAGAEVVFNTIQKRDRPDSAFYIGKGKTEELNFDIKQNDIDIVVFEDELSPVQMRNLEEFLEVNVLDRTAVILDIFAGRANSKEGKLQVELAQMQYILPRLTGYGTKLSRLGGGIGTRGPGETKLETDRRRIRKRISDLKKSIEEIKKHRELHRSRRKRDGSYTVSLVGYTNAGKSTLMNALSGSEVFTEDKLFATLDPTVRNLPLKEANRILLTDTVGFIRSMPSLVVKAFQATLEEIKEADLLFHVVDISHPEFNQQIDVVRDMLRDMKVDTRKEIMVFNKTDLMATNGVNLAHLKREYPYSCFISAIKQEGFEDLKDIIVRNYEKDMGLTNFYIPYEDSNFLSCLYREGRIIETSDHNGVSLRVKASVSEDFLKNNYNYTYPGSQKDVEKT